MLPFSDYPKQWLIARSVPAKFKGAKTRSFHGWQVVCADGLPIIEVRQGQGTDVPIGLILGWIILDGKFLDDGSKLHLASDETLEYVLRAACGRYVWLQSHKSDIRFGLDAGGLLAAVYSKELSVVASTPAMLNKIVELEPHRELWDLYNFPERMGCYSFGLTPWVGITRLLPNHILDLERFEAKRIWPSSSPNQLDRNDSDGHFKITAEISQIAQRNAETIVQRDEGILLLSGGYDSRMLLAACRNLKNSLTCQSIGMQTDLDIVIACEVSKLADVHQEIIEIIPATDQQVTDWLHRSGYCIYDPVTHLVATVACHYRGRHAMSGTGGELLRGLDLQTGDLKNASIDLQTLLWRTQTPATPVVRDAAEKWLSGVQSFGRINVLDLSRIEMRYGCWAGPSGYGHPLELPSLHPMSTGQIFENWFSLSDEYRVSGQFYADHMKRFWPELLSIPANRASGLNRLKYLRSEIKRLIPGWLILILKSLR